MADRKTIVRTSEKTEQYLKESVRLVAIDSGKLKGKQFIADTAIRMYFRHVVSKWQTKGHANLINAELVRAAGLKPESRPQAQPAAGNDETPRKAP